MSPSLEELQKLLGQGRLSMQDVLLLRREIAAPFKLHPLGFVVSTLVTDGARKIRLHYWPLTGGVQQSPYCQIHDHLFEFRSWVLAGAVQNVEYAASSMGDEFAVYESKYSGDRSILTRTEATLRLSEDRRSTYNAGMSYTVAAGVLHETIRVSDRPALTVLLTSDVSTSAPKVLGPLTGCARYVYERRVLGEAVANEMLAAL